MADTTGPGGDSPPPPITGTGPGIDLSGLTDWLRRAVQGYFEEVYDAERNSAKMTAGAALTNEESRAAITHAALTALDAILKKLGEFVTSGSAEAGRLAAYTINNISGTHIDADSIFGDLSGTITREKMVDIGTQFRAVVDQMFPVGSSVVNDRDRADRGFALDNVGAYFGTNLNYQLRSLSIAILGSAVPGFDLTEFKNLHESLLWAYGLPWMSWSVLSAIMNATTTKPLQEYYNARIKGNDYSESEALHAFVQKRIDAGTLNKVLDNLGMRDDIRNIRIEQTRTDLTVEQAVKGFIEGHIDAATFTRVMDAHGVRDDVRDAKVAMARPDLTEGDIQEGYNNGLFVESDVNEFYTEKGFNPFNKQAKIDLVKDQRLFQFRKRLEETMFHGYVIGTVTQSEFTNYLSSINYNALEVEMELKRAEIIMRSHQQKHLTRAEILRLVADGSMQASDGLARLVAQGLPDPDARRLLADSVLRHAVSMVPSKIRDACTGPDVERNLLTAAITTATEIDPQYIIENKDFFQQAKCILEQYVAPSSGGGGTPPPTGPPPPTNLIATKTGADVILTWIAPVAGLEYTPYRRSTADATAIQLTSSSLATSYVDRNVPVGHTYVYTVRSKFAGQESVDSNQVVVDVA